MSNEPEDYTPYGPEWVAEMMKLPKSILITQFATKCERLAISEANFERLKKIGEREWTRVEDGLPEESVHVLMLEIDGSINVGYFNGISFDYALDDYYYTSYNITHWQPLPTPPPTQEKQ